MTATMEDDRESPEWFARAVATTPETGTVLVDGAHINYRRWDPSGTTARPGLVLVHGGAANARWWDHVAPQLADDRTVIALDLSGHGESSHRPTYSRRTWAREVLAVADLLPEPPVLVGHSLGGFVTLEAAGFVDARLSGLVVLDSPVREITPEAIAAQTRRSRLRVRIHPTRETVESRFRPFPSGAVPPLDYLAQHIARHSVRQGVQGYSWQFDPKVMAQAAMAPSEVASLRCPVALVRGEFGSLTPELSRALALRTGPRTAEVCISGAGHHIMLDQPLALVDALERLTGGPLFRGTW